MVERIRGECPVCHRHIVVKVDGTLRGHTHHRGRRAYQMTGPPCDGAGRIAVKGTEHLSDDPRPPLPEQVRKDLSEAVKAARTDHRNRKADHHE